MARDKSQNEDQGSVAVADPEVNADETVVAEVDTPQGESTEAAAPNLNAFWSAVDSINTVEDDISTVVAEYEKLDRKGKMQATHGLKARTFAALDADEYAKAKALSAASKSLGSAASGDGSTADPSEELVNRIAGIFLAYEKLSADNQPLGERIVAAIEAARSDENSIPALLSKRLVETKMGRKPREGGGTRHNVRKHITQVFANLPEGTELTLKQLSEAKSEEYGDDVATVPSLQTHLGNNFDEPGFEVITETKGEGDEAKTKITGVRKVALAEA